ncbi:AP-3 complex subunit delta [Cornus florida]|uniref:AP-3 complex subunit delta n=1 Tax=Cornus florida TaxID=4283 RepID=UPI00289EAEE6|nr:AP-3 complex subunit delta [Cornus florida]XP_059641723.1 AP-3 complex subunit delta [Cornus florida]XP_059641724.1 AP-3 complex subunit delta [Cornus florida]
MAGSSSIMDSLFQRTLEDLIKGLRLQLVGESTFISKGLEEIRHEIKSTDPQTKSMALQKLTYLHSLHGVDMSWAAFHAVEVTSSARFHHKKIGYLAASQSFHSGTDVILLITNQLRKDLNATNELEVSLALECLSVICTPDLARDLTPELFTLLSSTKTLVRKKAIATLLRVFSRYPDAVRVCFKRLVENLEESASDLQTVSAAVGLFCELTAKDPKSYLPLAPEFYRILVDSRNNWVLIKVLKIFAKLAALEPRLAKRIVEPICEHMRRTCAKSLIFECIQTIVTSLSEYESAVKLAVVKIRELLVDDDPNLKYLGLQALLVAAPRHLWAVLENKEVVIKSLSDADPNIKLEALRLVMSIVSEDNVAEICRVLVNYALKSDPEFCNEILGSILSTCSRNVYEIIVDFDWYVSLLGEMSRIPHCQKGEELENQLIDIGMRVKDVRPELVHVSRDLLIDPALLGNPFLHRILSAAAWVSGEYVEFSKNPSELMEALLQPRTSLLPPLIRAVYIQSAFKVLTFCLHSYLMPNEAVASSSAYPIDLEPGVIDSVSERECVESSDLATCEAPANSERDEGFNPMAFNEQVEELSADNGGDIIVVHGQTSSLSDLKRDRLTQESIVNLLDIIETALGQLTGSHEVEIQERARNVLGLVELIQKVIRGCVVQNGGIFEKEELKACEIINLVSGAFSEELGPVSSSAQGRIPIPDGITLTDNLRDLDTICGDMQSPKSSPFSLGRSLFGERDGNSIFNRDDQEDSVPSTESTSLLAEHRKRHGLYYLPSEKKEIISNDYPLANDSKLRDNVNDDTVDLVMLAEQSLVLKKKPNQTKPRPVVVKLDGDKIPIIAKKPELEDDLISVAVRDVLLGNEAIPTSSRSNLSNKSSSKRRGKEILNIDQVSESKENLNVEKSELGNQSSRRSKHRPHGKERKHRSPGKNVEEGEENGEKDKQKSSHRHGRHKARQRADGGVNVAAQTPIIPDFLL